MFSSSDHVMIKIRQLILQPAAWLTSTFLGYAFVDGIRHMVFLYEK
jgi:hypothetical protein